MKLSGLKYVDSDFNIISGSILVDGELIGGFEGDDSDEMNMQNLLALPGFIDIHTHGGSQVSPADGDEQSLQKLTMHYARHGVTSFCPSTVTLPHDELVEIFKSVENIKGREQGAYIQGINMEGPYVSKEKCGAQNTDYIRKADVDEFFELNSISKISLVDLAPEPEGALDFAREVSKHTVCSIAHTNATYDEARKGFSNGFSHVTHFFNAMTPLSHRAPGVVGAVFENDKVTAELICDGFHLDEATVRLAFKLLGANRCVAISDSLSSADCEDGEYILGGQKVIVKDSKALLENGTIAGSTSNLFDEFRNLLSFGIPFNDALAACSLNPARVIGVSDKCGSIEKGKNADLIFVDEGMNLRHVMIKGRMIF